MKTTVKARIHNLRKNPEHPVTGREGEALWDADTEGLTQHGSFLSAIPSILDGLLSILDIGGTLLEDIPDSRSSRELDIAALKNDWILVGQDIRNALFIYSESEPSEHLTYE